VLLDPAQAIPTEHLQRAVAALTTAFLRPAD
jgi:hypothetical protein